MLNGQTTNTYRNLSSAGGSMVKNPPADAGNIGLIPGFGKSPGEGKKATHSSILVWRIP